MKWLRSYFSTNPIPFVLLAFAVWTLFTADQYPGKADFQRLVSLILIGGVVVFLLWRWDQDRNKH